MLISLVGMFTCAFIPQIKAQVNYVLNPSFEQYSKCPHFLDQIQYALHWAPIDSTGNPDSLLTQPLCAPDYCNTCAISGDVSVPLSTTFFQYPRTGNGMVQIRVLLNPAGPIGLPDVRDYLQGTLYKPLTAGKNYCVTFYVNLAEISSYAIDKIGAYIDDGSIDIGQDSAGCANPQTAYTPQIYAPAIINDTMDWVQVQGLFTASGTETFITIGNFFDFSHTDKIAVDYWPDSYEGVTFYLIDDVSVVETGTSPNAGPDAYVSPGSDSATIGSSEEGLPLTWFVYGSLVPIGHTGSLKVHPDTTTTYVLSMDLCDGVTFDTVTVWVAPTKVGNVQMSQCENVKIWPNPVHNELTVINGANSDLKILNLLGQQLYEASVNSNKDVLNVGQLIPGVYVVQITAPDGNKKCMQLVKE